VKRILRLPWIAVAIALASAPILGAPPPPGEIVTVSLPTLVQFAVTNVGVSTVGTPNPSHVSFLGASLKNNKGVHFAIKADSNFVPPSGTAIPASKVSWATSNVSHGIGTNGTLSTAAYGDVFQADADSISGGFDIVWTLAAPGTPLRAGAHSLTLRWKLESIKP
jgi:hypothetical protein